MLRLIIIKLLKTKDNEKNILRAARKENDALLIEKQQFDCQQISYLKA